MFGKEYLPMEVELTGIFIAKVIDNTDPKALERVRVRVMGVHDFTNEDKKNSIWASHLAPSKQNSGEIPDNDDFIYVTFIQNNPSACVWLGWCRTIG
jgi:hypothetical protein